MGVEDLYSNLDAYQNHPDDLQKTQITSLHTHLPGMEGIFIYIGGGNGDQG